MSFNNCICISISCQNLIYNENVFIKQCVFLNFSFVRWWQHPTLEHVEFSSIGIDMGYIWYRLEAKSTFYFKFSETQLSWKFILQWRRTRRQLKIKEIKHNSELISFEIKFLKRKFLFFQNCAKSSKLISIRIIFLLFILA